MKTYEELEAENARLKVEIETMRMQDAAFSKAMFEEARLEREKNARHVAEVERLQREEHSIKEALGLLAGGVGLPVSEHVRQVVDEKNHLEEKLAEVTAGCDLQRGDKVYRQVPVVIGPGKTQAELDLDAEKQKNARLTEENKALRSVANISLLARYGHHDGDCPRNATWAGVLGENERKCKCGLDDALRPKV